MPDSAFMHAVPQEAALVDIIDRLGKWPEGRMAVHIRLSSLSRTHTRMLYLNLAEDVFTAALRGVEGQLFRLHNHDFVYVASGAPAESIGRAIDRLRTLFSEDPVVARREPEAFCGFYRFESDYDDLRLAAQEWLRGAEQAQSDYARPDPLAGLAPIRPELVARVERALESADLANLVRRQMVCTLLKEQSPQPVFEELYVSIPDLQAQVTPGVNWLADPWLFRYLTQALDKRVMALLAKQAGSPAPFSLNLNIATVLTPEFRHFDGIVPAQTRGRLVIEFNKLDVFADMEAFLFARDYLHERGYRLCLDGLTHLTLPYCNRARLGFDLVKIVWPKNGVEDVEPEMFSSLREIVKETGQARTILCRCDNIMAIELGRRMGIVMFQGRHVDQLLAANKAGAGP